ALAITRKVTCLEGVICCVSLRGDGSNRRAVIRHIIPSHCPAHLDGMAAPGPSEIVLELVACHIPALWKYVVLTAYKARWGLVAEDSPKEHHRGRVHSIALLLICV